MDAPGPTLFATLVLFFLVDVYVSTQLVRSAASKSASNLIIISNSAGASNRYSYLAPLFTEIGELVKGFGLGVPVE